MTPKAFYYLLISGKGKKICWAAIVIVALAACFWVSFPRTKGTHQNLPIILKKPSPSLLPGPQTMNSGTSVAPLQNGSPSSFLSETSSLFSPAQAFDPLSTPLVTRDTRLHLEQLTALYTPEELQEELRRLSIMLPLPVYHEFVRLLDSYQRYVSAVKEAYPPDKEVTTVEEALAQLEGIHSLRQTFFGHQVAEAFFGEEERFSRKVLQLMALEADANLSLPEKAHKALMLLQANPDLAQVNDPKRN